MGKKKHSFDHQEQERRVEIIRKFLVEQVKVESRFHLSSWFIRRFLRARDFDIKNTQTQIEGYFTFKRRIEDKIRRDNKPPSKCSRVFVMH